jgi:hypothetical protein
MRNPADIVASIAILLFIVTIVSVYSIFGDVGSGPYEPMHVKFPFIMLDYISDLAVEYMERTGQTPPDVLPGRAKECIDILSYKEKKDGFLAYIRRKNGTVSGGDITVLLSQLFFAEMEEIKSMEHHRYRSFDLNSEESYLLSSHDTMYAIKTEGAFLYIGFLVFLNGDIEKEGFGVIASMGDECYFQDYDGTPYKGGNVIMIRIKIPPEIKRSNNQNIHDI